jgi:prepilin-type processing-associated H-X9-DG protein
MAHNEGNNLSYWDGHVKWIPFNGLKTATFYHAGQGGSDIGVEF